MGNLRELIPYGYRSVSGGVWNNSHVGQYNRLQEQINGFIREG